MKRIGPYLLFFACLTLFVSQTARAFETVFFHSAFLAVRTTVVIDAGHGGEDGGAVGINGALEKDINLAVALELQNLLRRNNFEVVMIRDSDCAVGDGSLATVAERKRSDLRARLQAVEEAGDCVLISIHQNHFTESKYHGAQVFYSPNREESALLAECMRESIVTGLQPENTRQNKPADEQIYLLNNCRVPGVLVECGFLSNPEEAERLCDENYQKQMAACIYQGLVDYLRAAAREKNGEETDKVQWYEVK